MENPHTVPQAVRFDGDVRSALTSADLSSSWHVADSASDHVFRRRGAQLFTVVD